MIDPVSIAQGVVTGMATNKAMQATQSILGNDTDERSRHTTVIELLTDIRNILSPEAQDAIEESMQLQPYPSEYIVDTDFHDRAHVCILFYTATPVRFDGIFGGSLQKNVGPGWFQLDQAGRLSTTDATAHFVTISYRDDALGSSF